MNQRYIVFPLLALLLGLAAVQRGEAQLLNATTRSLDLGEARVYSIASALDTLLAFQGGVIIDNWSFNTASFRITGSIPRSMGDSTGPSTVVININFIPTTPGLVIDTLRIEYRGKQQQSKPDTLMVFVRGRGLMAPDFVRSKGGAALKKEIDFGSRTPGTPNDTVIFMRNNDSSNPLRILGQNIQNAGATFTLPDRLDSGFIGTISLSDTIRLRFTPPAAGDYIGAYIVTTGSGTDTLMLRGQGAEPGLDSLVIRPVIDFGTIERTTCQTLNVTIYNPDTVSIVIDTMIIVIGGIQGPFSVSPENFTLRPGDSLPLTVQYCAPRVSQKGCDADTLRLISGTSSRDILLRGCGAVRSIDILPDTLIDFGDVDVGGLQDKSYTISNPGPLSVNVDSQSLSSGNDFMMVTQSTVFKLDSGASQPMKVRFMPQPTSSGRVWDTVTITGNAGKRKIVLTGNVPPVWLVTTSVDFGDVHVLRDSVIDVYLKNISSTVAQVQNAGLVNPFGPVGFKFSPRTVQDVFPGESHTFTITFAPGDTGYVQDKLVINDPGTSSYAAITLTGHGISDKLEVDSTLSTLPVRFNPVALGDSTEASFTVRNNGNVTATLDPGTTDNSAFTVISPSVPKQIPPSGIETITLRFKPTRPGPVSATWESKPNGLKELLYATAAYRIWFKPAFGEAGDTIPLELRIEPPLRGQAITGFTAELSVEPTALFAEAVSSNCSPLVRDSSGRITISSITGDVVSDSVLAIITFRGLSTGKPENVVSLDAFTFTPDLPVALENGVIYLSGCDIGRTALAARRAKIGALKASPGSDQAELTYSAAEGAPVAVRIVGIDGQLLREEALPDGTGADHTVVLPLAELPPGLVFVELRVVNDRSTIPLMIIR